MKLSVFLMLLGLLRAGATVNAQATRVNLNLQNVACKEVFELIKSQTNVDFFYSNKEVDVNREVSISCSNASLEEALKQILGDEYSFRVVDNTVIIRPIPKTATQAQEEVRVVGTVKDASGNPLPGVTILLKGTSMGVVTDAEGKYAFSMPKQENVVLVYSFIGMKTVEVKYAGQEKIDIVMQEDEQEIEEVVVTGYQAIKEKGMAGSYTKIKAEELVQTGTTTLESMLQGKIPGMVVINTSGLTGTRQKVRVRGTSTLIGNAEPVWVVDGIIQEDNLPFDASQLTNMDDNIDMMRDFIGGAISWLDPHDIDDITVLKDAAATAIYGVKAANGVILITTKKGEHGRMSVNYSGHYSASQRMNYNRQEVMNSKERVDLSREAFERGARIADEKVGYISLAHAYANREIDAQTFHAGVKRLETLNTDWFDVLYRTPFSQSHSVSFSGGSNHATYRVSFGYRNVQNTAIGNDQEAYTGSLRTSLTFWEKLTMTASLSGSHTITKAFASGVDPFNYAINTSRVIGCYDENGGLSYYDKGGYRYHILNELANSGNENTQKSASINLNLRWRVNEDLALSAVFGGTTSSSSAESWFTEQSNRIARIRGYEWGEKDPMDDEFLASPLPYGGMLSQNESQNFNYTARLQAEYTKMLNSVHSLNFMAGVEVRSNKYDGSSLTSWGYMPERGKTFTNPPLVIPATQEQNSYASNFPTITDRLSNYFSYYATAGYMYDNRYSINLSVRGDASNAFGENSRFLPVWSMGLRWNVSDEVWMQDQNIVNNLAFTASLGYQGSVVEGVGPEIVTKILPVDSETGEYKMELVSLPNPDLKWEKTLSVNLGAHFALFKSKLNGSFNWYYKKTTDLITKARVPYENGTTSMYVNDGDMTNTGWDLSLNVVPVRTKNFMWSLGTSFSGNTNDVDSELETNGNWKNAVNGSTNKKGYPVGSFWAFKYKGLDPTNGKPLFDLDPNEMAMLSNGYIEDYGEVEDATSYMVYMGTREPTFTMGLNMTFRWKRFSIPLNIYISKGNKEFLSSPYENGYMMMSETQNASTELLDRWRKPGDEKFTNIPSIPVGDNCRPIVGVKPGSSAAFKTDLYPLDAWAYSDVRVVDAWYVRFSDIRLSYSLPEKWISSFAKNVTCSFTMTNPLQIRSNDFKGRDPEVALGSQPRSQDYSFSLSMSF